MRVVISSAHGARVGGANALIQEVPESRRVADRVAQAIRELGHQAVVFHESSATTQTQNVSNIIAFHNSQVRDCDISVHFNSVTGNVVRDGPIGTEVFFSTAKDLATRVARGISDASGLINRGAKLGRFSFLTRTAKPAILIEVCFVMSRADVRLYQTNFEAICLAIARSITGGDSRVA